MQNYWQHKQHVPNKILKYTIGTVKINTYRTTFYNTEYTFKLIN